MQPNIIVKHEETDLQSGMKMTAKGDGRSVVWSIPGNPTNFQDFPDEMERTEVIRTSVTTISHKFYMVTVTLCRRSIEPKIGEFFYPIHEFEDIEILHQEFPQLFGVNGNLYVL